MPYCSIPKCSSCSQKGQKVFKVPKNDEESQVWIEFLKNNNVKQISENTRVCELHFIWFKTSSSELVRSKHPTIDLSDIEVKIIINFMKQTKKCSI